MRHIIRGILLAVIACILSTAVSVEAGPTRYAAIAYSPSTGLYGYGNGFSTKADAIERALQECGGRDARTNWCRNAWIALAISDSSPGGYGWAWATSAAGARRAARAKCLEENDDARVVLCVSAYR